MAKPIQGFIMRTFLPRPTVSLYRRLGKSWKYAIHGEERFQAALADDRTLAAAFFHARTFQLLHYVSRPGNGRWLLMCSKSRDGELMAKVEEGMGCDVVRGSTGDGGARALVEMIQRLKKDGGLSTCLAVDASRGPRGIAKPGVITLAQKTGGVLLPVAASADRTWVYKHSWDRVAVPKWGATVHVVFGEPLEVPRKASPDEREDLRKELEDRLLALHAEADEQSGFRDTEPLQLAAKA
ncbi:MAG: lysophospholipid acyltransferase family protein [bacterium]|nr:lysophospholipid acyltransferase family protein [bacterium]